MTIVNDMDKNNIYDIKHIETSNIEILEKQLNNIFNRPNYTCKPATKKGIAGYYI